MLLKSLPLWSARRNIMLPAEAVLVEREAKMTMIAAAEAQVDTALGDADTDDSIDVLLTDIDNLSKVLPAAQVAARAEEVRGWTCNHVQKAMQMKPSATRFPRLQALLQAASMVFPASRSSNTQFCVKRFRMGFSP